MDRKREGGEWAQYHVDTDSVDDISSDKPFDGNFILLVFPI